MMNPQKRSQLKAGIILILAGAGFLFLNMTEGIQKIYVMLLFSAIFIGVYLYWKNYAVLIPGSILLGLSLGLLSEKYHIPLWNPVLAGLGLGFLFIYLIDSKISGKTHWWPLVPGFTLILFNILLKIMEWIAKIPDMINYITQRPPLVRLLEYGGPAVLLFLGGYMVFVSFQPIKEENSILVTNEPVSETNQIPELNQLVQDINQIYEVNHPVMEEKPGAETPLIIEEPKIGS